MKYNKTCSVCRVEFTTKHKMQNLCSFDCQQEAGRKRSRLAKKRKKVNKNPPCEICGYQDTIDIHHEGIKTYNLCPNHHALITRNIKTLEQLFRESRKNVSVKKALVPCEFTISKNVDKLELRYFLKLSTVSKML